MIGSVGLIVDMAIADAPGKWRGDETIVDTAAIPDRIAFVFVSHLLLKNRGDIISIDVVATTNIGQDFNWRSFGSTSDGMPAFRNDTDARNNFRR